MKDSRTGMMGLVVVICVLAIKFAGIYSIKTGHSGFSVFLFFLIIPAYSRAGMIFGMKFLKYGRDKGFGHDFFSRDLSVKDFIWLCIPVFLSLFTGQKFLTINILFALMIFLILVFYKSKMNCITGDMLGAMAEVVEAMLFLICGNTLF